MSPHGVGTSGLLSWARERASSRGQSTTSLGLGNALKGTKNHGKLWQEAKDANDRCLEPRDKLFKFFKLFNV